MSMKRPPSVVMTATLLAVPFFIMVCGGPGKAPPAVVPRIVAVLPHDTNAFTQGLFYDHGKLYESDGLYGQSALRALDAKSGDQLKRVPLDPRYFGEGCAKMDTMVVQLTWQEQAAFIWSFPALSEAGQPFFYGGEGWGLTSDGNRWYMSNGSDTIFVRNRSFTIVRTVPVTLRGSPVRRLNELEYVNGTIYANVWYTDTILAINPKNGRVVRVIDCSGLVTAEQPSSPDNVLNGIAYDPEAKRFYLTGKRWKKIFVVEIAN
jgi:glutaminyl-peptide cyclotransferase